VAFNSIFQALGDPTRRQILEKLRAGPKPVGRLAAGLPITRPAVSQHLKVLREAGLVHEERVGTRHVYSIELNGLAELRAYLDRFWDDVLKAFQAEARRKQRSN
jgi:DNA-binding transcriptional ArsR family regulator